MPTRYVCKNDSSHVFIYPARIQLTEIIPKRHEDQTLYDSQMKETHACPMCGCLDFQEILEPPKAKEERKIVSVREVEPNKADELLAQGYEVVEQYVKSVRLAKYAGGVQ